MTLLAVAFLIVGGLLILSGVEHQSILGTIDQILSGNYHVQRQSATGK